MTPAKWPGVTRWRCRATTMTSAKISGPCEQVRVQCLLPLDHFADHESTVPGSHGVRWRRRRPPHFLIKAIRGLTRRQRREVCSRYLWGGR